MSLVRVIFKQMDKIASLPHIGFLKYRFNAQLTRHQTEAMNFAEAFIYPNVKISTESMRKNYAMFKELLEENEQKADYISRSEIQFSERSEYLWRLFDARWELLECVQFILGQNTKEYAAAQERLAKDREQTLNELIKRIKRITKKDITHQVRFDELIQTLAKLYLYCEETDNLTELTAIKSCIKTILGTPDDIVKFYHNELVPYHPYPKKIMQDGLNLAREINPQFMPEKMPIYQEEKKAYRQELRTYPKNESSVPASREIKHIAESKDSKEFTLPVEEKIVVHEIKQPSVKLLHETAPTPVLYVPPPEQKTKPVKKVFLPFDKKALKEAIKKKRLAARAKTPDIESKDPLPAEIFHTKQEKHKQKIFTLLNETRRQQTQLRMEGHKKKILTSLEKHKITLSKKPELSPYALEYAKRIAPLGLAAIHGGSVRQALKSTMPETKDHPEAVCDVDIVVYDAKLEPIFPRTDFTLISNTEKIITVAPIIFDPNCSVSIIKKFELNNLNTIMQSAFKCDFTINTFLAIFKNDTGEVDFYSPLGEIALKHLRENRLVVAHPGGPDVLFQTNPICMLRALRFVVEKKHVPKEDIFPAINKENAEKLLELAPQVINTHLNKLLMHGIASKYLENPAFMVVFRVLFPQFSHIDLSLLQKIFTYIDDKTSRGKIMPLTSIYCALLMAKIANQPSFGSLTTAMEMSYRENKLLELAFSRISSRTRALIFTNTVNDFSFLFNEKSSSMSSEPVSRHDRPSLCAR